jgi:GNAT superfamily N-acetyltransferase
MLKIKTLEKEHDRSRFDCGTEALNLFLRNTARQHIVKGISKTFVLIEDTAPTEILGFFTLAFCEIVVAKLPHKYAKKYPPKAPGAKLARLAVDKKFQRRGYGSIMMMNAVERVITVSEHLGIIGFFVDAKDEQAEAYYEQFGFITLPDNPLELFIPLETLRQAYVLNQDERIL